MMAVFALLLGLWLTSIALELRAAIEAAGADQSVERTADLARAVLSMLSG
jgi:hypothetical protein